LLRGPSAKNKAPDSMFQLLSKAPSTLQSRVLT
jgi:hypothetical protein